MASRSRSPPQVSARVAARERPVRIDFVTNRAMGPLHLYCRLSETVELLKFWLSLALQDRALEGMGPGLRYAAGRIPPEALTVSVVSWPQPEGPTWAGTLLPLVMTVVVLEPPGAILRSFNIPNLPPNGSVLRVNWNEARWGDFGPPAEVETPSSGGPSDTSEDAGAV